MRRIKKQQRFGRWTTKESVRVEGKRGRLRTKWVVLCDCGTESLVASDDLNSGKSTQCRSCSGTATKDLSGHAFGSWLVIEPGEKKNGKTHWICRCDCGAVENVCSASLLGGVSTRCVECYRNRMGTHKKCSHPLYGTWATMIARCENPKSKSYEYYGGRGITVCREWHSVSVFIRDVGERPDGTSLDRIDNDRGYFPENCRWATAKEQANNRSNNKNNKD